MTKDAEVIEHWMITFYEQGRGLSKWEEDFMESICEQFEERGSISDKQEEILEQIYGDRT